LPLTYTKAGGVLFQWTGWLWLAGRGKVSEFRVASINTHKKGYLSVRMRLRNGSVKSFFVHRLVGMTFIDNPDNKPCINHIDGVKSNNHVSNLEWCTVAENNEHAFAIGLNKRGITERPYVSVKTEWGIYTPILDLNTGIFYKTKELAKMLGYATKSVTKMLNGERENKFKNYVRV